MRLEGLAHNTSLYLPELHPALELLAVPADDREAIEAALAFPSAPPGEPRAPIVHVSSADVDSRWVGPPYPESLYRATLTVDTAPAAMGAGSQHTVDVRVTNQSDVVWRWGRDARPEIRLAYRWLSEGVVVDEPKALRTTFPADLPPGETLLTPVHVVAPQEPGAYTLEIDLVHEHVRWFGCGVSNAVHVRRRERIAVIARPERLPDVVAALRLGPEVEPVVVLRDPSDREAYGDYESVVGLREYLLAGAEGSGRKATLARLLWRTLLLSIRSRGKHWSRPAYESVLRVASSTEWLVVDGANWGPEAALGREWLALAATALMWRLAGQPVLVVGRCPPGRPRTASGLRQVDAATRAFLRGESRLEAAADACWAGLGVRPLSCGDELLCLRPGPGWDRRLALAPERELGAILHVVRPELLELALPKSPPEPRPEPLGNRRGRVRDARSTGCRQGAFRPGFTTDFGCEGHELPPLQRTWVPVIVLGYLDVTEPAGRLAPLPGGATLELHARPWKRRHLFRERPRQRNLGRDLERGEKVGERRRRRLVRKPRLLVRLAGELDLRSHDEVRLDATDRVPEREADHAERDELDDAGAVQREVRSVAILKDAEARPETALDRVQDTDGRRFQIDRDARVRAGNVFDLATTESRLQEALLHRCLLLTPVDLSPRAAGPLCRS